MYINLDQGGIADAAEAVYLASFHHEDVTCTGFKLLSVDDPDATALPHDLYFIVRVPVWARPTAGLGAEEEHGDIHVPLLSPDELMRAPLKRKVLLTDTMHGVELPV
jgi:hypothetical protein